MRAFQRKFSTNQPEATQQPIITKGFLDTDKISHRKRNASKKSVYPEGANEEAQSILHRDLCFVDVHKQQRNNHGGSLLVNHPGTKVVSTLNGEEHKMDNPEAFIRRWRFAGMALLQDRRDSRVSNSQNETGVSLQEGGVGSTFHTGVEVLMPGDRIMFAAPPTETTGPNSMHRSYTKRPNTEGRIPFILKRYNPNDQGMFLTGIASEIFNGEAKTRDFSQLKRARMDGTHITMTALEEEAVAFKYGLIGVAIAVLRATKNNPNAIEQLTDFLKAGKGNLGANTIESKAADTVLRAIFAAQNVGDTQTFAVAQRRLKGGANNRVTQETMIELNAMNLLMGGFASATKAQQDRCIGRGLNYATGSQHVAVYFGSA